VSGEPPEDALMRMGSERATAYTQSLASLREDVTKLRDGARDAPSKYVEIDQLRKKRAQLDFAEQQEQAQKAEEDHAKSMVLLESVRGYLSGATGTTRSRLLKELVTFNQVQSTSSGGVQGVDLCIMMDCTNSMQHWIESAKETIKAIVTDTKATLFPAGGGSMRVGYVGYRDFDQFPPNRFIIQDFTDDLDSVIKEIERGMAMGGNDEPEDVAGGLQEVNRLSWKAPGDGQLNVTVMVADAPAHGSDYEQTGKSSGPSLQPKLEQRMENGTFQTLPREKYPDAKKELTKLLEQRANYFFFFACKSEDTLRMSNAFRREKERLNRKSAKYVYEQVDIGGDTDTNIFKDKVIHSVQKASDNMNNLIGQARA